MFYRSRGFASRALHAFVASDQGIVNGRRKAMVDETLFVERFVAFDTPNNSMFLTGSTAVADSAMRGYFMHGAQADANMIASSICHVTVAAAARFEILRILFINVVAVAATRAPILHSNVRVLRSPQPPRVVTVAASRALILHGRLNPARTMITLGGRFRRCRRTSSPQSTMSSFVGASITYILALRWITSIVPNASGTFSRARVTSASCAAFARAT